MHRDKFVEELKERGFELWDKKEMYEVYGKVIYHEDDLGEDYEMWYVYNDRAMRYFSTNREVRGREMCPFCGRWVKREEYIKHVHECQPMIVWFG